MTLSNKDVFLGGFRKHLKELEPDLLLKGVDSGQGAVIYANKSFLAAGSVVFEKMLLEEDKFKTSAKLETVTLSDMKHEEVEALVEFMHSTNGSITSTTLKKHARSLYIAAEKYDIPLLKDLSRYQLKLSLNSSNALSILELAQIPYDKALTNAAFIATKNSMSAIVNSDEFRLFVFNHTDLAVELVKAGFGQMSAEMNARRGNKRRHM